MGESSEPEEAAESEEVSRGEDHSGEEEEEASRGADPSRGSASSSRSAPVEVDLQVLSSSDEEDTFRVARSRRVEEEEETSGDRRGRSEPRSKAIQDRSAATVRGTPREEARAPQEEVGARNTQPPRAKKRVWVVTGE